MSSFEGAVITIVCDRQCAGAQTLNSNHYAFLIEGDPELAHQLALEKLREFERGGHTIKAASLVRSDSESSHGTPLEHIRLERPKPHGAWQSMSTAPQNTPVMVSICNQGQASVIQAIQHPEQGWRSLDTQQPIDTENLQMFGWASIPAPLTEPAVEYGLVAGADTL